MDEGSSQLRRMEPERSSRQAIDWKDELRRKTTSNMDVDFSYRSYQSKSHSEEFVPAFLAPRKRGSVTEVKEFMQKQGPSSLTEYEEFGQKKRISSLTDSKDFGLIKVPSVVPEVEYTDHDKESTIFNEDEDLSREKRPSSFTGDEEFISIRKPSDEQEYPGLDTKKYSFSDTEGGGMARMKLPQLLSDRKLSTASSKSSRYLKVKSAELKKLKLPDIRAEARIELPSPFTGWDFERPVKPRDFAEFPEIVDAIPQLIRLSISREERLSLPELLRYQQHYIHKTAPLTDGDSYLLKYGIVELLEYMMVNLVMYKPDKPIDFLVDLTRSIMRQMKARYEMAQLLESASISDDGDKATYLSSIESSSDGSQNSFNTHHSQQLET